MGEHMRLFNFRKKKNAAGNLQSFSNVNAASLNIPVHADSEPFASDNDINNFTKAIGDEYVSKKQLELTKEDLEKISITDGAEMWRLYSWYHREVMPDDTDQKRKLSSQRINTTKRRLSLHAARCTNFHQSLCRLCPAKIS
jgi:hypothetical protein